jgi:hypothetical protein
MISGVKKPKCTSIRESVGDAKLRNELQECIRHYSDLGKGWMIHGSFPGRAGKVFLFQYTHTGHEAHPVS